MTDLNTELAGTRAAVEDLISAAERSTANWTASPAPGKWSPSQIVEHVAMALEESAHAASGTPSKFPTLPVFVRPLVRIVFFNRVVKHNAFPKSTAPNALKPTSGPPTPADARIRLERAVTRFNQACVAVAGSGKRITSTIFGAVSVEDFARFQAIHTRHHCKQMPGAT